MVDLNVKEAGDDDLGVDTGKPRLKITSVILTSTLGDEENCGGYTSPNFIIGLSETEETRKYDPDYNGKYVLDLDIYEGETYKTSETNYSTKPWAIYQPKLRNPWHVFLYLKTSKNNFPDIIDDTHQNPDSGFTWHKLKPNMELRIAVTRKYKPLLGAKEKILYKTSETFKGQKKIASACTCSTFIASWKHRRNGNQTQNHRTSAMHIENIPNSIRDRYSNRSFPTFIEFELKCQCENP